MENLTFHLEEFDGPLDVLLYLVSKNKMNLYDIAILDLIDQYTAIINQLQQNRMDVASEFIEMAARLVQMKSFLLLPRSEEAQRMKEELTGQLIEYSACKEVARQMGEQALQHCSFVRSPLEMERDSVYEYRHEPSILLRAMQQMMGKVKRKKQPTVHQFEPRVTAPFVSVASRVVYVLRILVLGQVNSLRQLFSRKESRSHTVATFLAVLELIRAGRLQIEADETLSIHRNSSK